MGKNTYFTGQPIFSQLINLIPKGLVSSLARTHQTDYYTKKFDTYSHLITMLFVIYKGCNSLREVEMGMGLCHQKLGHLGINYVPARSTLSEANFRRSSEVFAQIHRELYKRLSPFLPDSRSSNRDKRLYIVDSTTVMLFQEIMGSIGSKPMNGKRKGGYKVHTVIRADEDVPRLVRIGRAASNDVNLLKEIHLPAGSILTFDKGYVDYSQYHRLSKENVTIVTRLRQGASFTLLKQLSISQYHLDKGVMADCHVILGHTAHKGVQRVDGRIVTYRDPLSGRVFEFYTNNRKLSPLSIAQIYKKRWQIEVLFKRLKQNYPLKYFLGDNENAIRIQTWCALIADIILKVIKSGIRRKWSFSGIAAIVRQHLLEYVDLLKYLQNPQKATQFYRIRPSEHPPNLFSNTNQGGLKFNF